MRSEEEITGPRRKQPFQALQKSLEFSRNRPFHTSSAKAFKVILLFGIVAF